MGHAWITRRQPRPFRLGDEAIDISNRTAGKPCLSGRQFMKGAKTSCRSVLFFRRSLPEICHGFASGLFFD